MSEIIQETEEIYRVREIPLNAILTDKIIELDTPLIYILNTPITVQARLNEKGSGLFTLNRLSLIKASEGKKITRLYITTTETSTDTLELMFTDKEILGQIGTKSAVTLTTSLGVEYDARLRLRTSATLLNQAITTIQTYDGLSVDMSTYDKGAFTLINNSDVQVSIQFQVLTEGSEWFDIGSAIILTASGGKDTATISDSWRFIRATATNTVLGTTGSVLVYGSFK